MYGTCLELPGKEGNRRISGSCCSAELAVCTLLGALSWGGLCFQHRRVIRGFAAVAKLGHGLEGRRERFSSSQQSTI